MKKYDKYEIANLVGRSKQNEQYQKENMHI